MRRRDLPARLRASFARALALAAVLALSAVSGCGHDDTAGVTRVDNLFGITNDIVGFDIWSHAPAGCDGAVDRSDVSVAWAQGEPALGVLVLDGEVLCVDTWESIAAELDRFKGDPAPDPMLPEHLEDYFEYEEPAE